MQRLRWIRMALLGGCLLASYLAGCGSSSTTAAVNVTAAVINNSARRAIVTVTSASASGTVTVDPGSTGTLTVALTGSAAQDPSGQVIAFSVQYFNVSDINTVVKTDSGTFTEGQTITLNG